MIQAIASVLGYIIRFFYDLVGQNFIESYLKLDDYNKLVINALTNELVKIQKSTKAKKEA